MTLSLEFTKEDLLNKFHSQDLPIIIYGAGVAGQVLLQACYKEGIQIECFCDSNIKKKGNTLFDLEVVHTDDIKNRYLDANWLIAAADILDISNHLIEYGYNEERLYAASIFLKDFDISKFHEYLPYNKNDNDVGFVEFAVASTVQCHEGYLNPDKIFMRSVDIVVTEKCTMKCLDCSNLMQYFEKPINYEINEMNNAIDLLCSFSDEIYEFRVIGGEPLVNKNVHHVIERLISEPKVKRIVIYTNGNIIPKERQLVCLQHEKVLFNITDYSKCGENIDDEYTAKLSRFKRTTDQLEQLCKDKNIDYRRHPPENWTDCGRIEKFNRTLEENKEVFNACCCKNLTTLSKNELHRCPFSAQITRLGVCENKEDYFDLTDVLDLDWMRNKLNSFLNDKDKLDACDFCPGRPLSDPQITPAIQIKKPIKYKSSLGHLK